MCNYEYSGPLNGFLQLGSPAAQVPDVDLQYDPPTCKITSNDRADSLLCRSHRKGWALQDQHDAAGRHCQ